MLRKAKKILPKAVPFRKLLGPSFILLGLGLGSGEIILWPYLVSNFGLGIAWGAVLGITFQYFINMEIERYTLARGESVFVGLARRFPKVPYWLIISTLVSFGWPGIVASSAVLLSHVFGGEKTLFAIGLMLLIGIILSFGKYIYTTVERFSQLIILVGVPLIVVLTLWLANGEQLGQLALGVVGKGDGYWFLPAAIPLSVFLGAFAFSGAAGNLNLTQSSYIREKGYGMGAYMDKLKGLFGGDTQKVELNGYEFNATPENISRFNEWWKAVKREHFIVFYLTGAFTMLLLMLLSYATAFGHPSNATGIQFVLNEASYIAGVASPMIGSIFTAILGVLLFSTQFSVLDSTSRIMSENYAVLTTKKTGVANMSREYFIFLWLQIIFGIAVFAFGLREPLQLLVVGANINAICMFVHIGLVNYLNYKELPKEIQPSAARRVVVMLAFVFFGLFSLLTLWQQFAR